MKGTRTTVIIDRVVLRGVEPRLAQALTASLKQELARVLSESSARAGLNPVRRTEPLRLGRLPLDAGTAGARRFGINVARAIGKRMKP